MRAINVFAASRVSAAVRFCHDCAHLRGPGGRLLSPRVDSREARRSCRAITPSAAPTSSAAYGAARHRSRPSVSLCVRASVQDEFPTRARQAGPSDEPSGVAIYARVTSSDHARLRLGFRAGLAGMAERRSSWRCTACLSRLALNCSRARRER